MLPVNIYNWRTLICALYPISIAAVCDLIENKCIIKTTGVLLFSYALGSVLGPIMVSSYMDIANSSSAIFNFIAIVSALYGIIGFYKILKKDVHMPSDDMSVNFMPVPKNSQIVMQLDPRQYLNAQKGDLRTAIEDEGIIEQNACAIPFINRRVKQALQIFRNFL